MTEQLRAADAPGFLRAAPTEEAVARWQRCRRLSPVQRGETERLVAQFMTTRSIAICPTRYAAPVEQRAHVARSRH
jgi:hypothetical protein